MSKPNYSWDASVFIAWLDAEESAPLTQIASVVEEIDAGTANLIVSVTAYSEILEVKRTKRKMEKFKNFLKRSNVLVVETTVAIAEKAAEIRSKGLKEKPPRKLKTPDATFMAVAILYKADMLHSLDPDFLALDGKPIVDGLAIKSPQTRDGQGVLFAPDEPAADEEPATEEESGA
jgi:predicted nucleic acid-binding protein